MAYTSSFLILFNGLYFLFGSPKGNFTIVHKVLDFFPNPFNSFTELSVSSHHRQHLTADIPVVM